MKRLLTAITVLLLQIITCNCYSQTDDFYWKEFDKPYFVFIHDDANQYLIGFANFFMSEDVPFSEAAIPVYLDSEKRECLKKVVAKGGEVLSHYSASPSDLNDDDIWVEVTRDTKNALENMGFEVNGIIRADNTQYKSNKGEKYCRKYYKYANDGMGKSTQYDMPRKLMLYFDSMDAFMEQIKEDCTVNGIHAYGFHGGRDDETWVTNENFKKVFDYIKERGNCEFTTYRYLYNNFGVLNTDNSSVDNINSDNTKSGSKKIISGRNLYIISSKGTFNLLGQRIN